jgi:hypothetical protein
LKVGVLREDRNFETRVSVREKRPRKEKEEKLVRIKKGLTKTTRKYHFIAIFREF